MAQQRLVTVQYSFGGLNRSSAIQVQPPYTCPDCLNVRGEDIYEQRERGGTRPGYGPAFYGQLGGNNPVRLLSSVLRPTTSGPNVWPEDFVGGSLGVLWSTLGTAPTIDGVKDMAYASDLTLTGAYHAAVPNTDFSSRQEASVFLVPYRGAWYGTVYLFMWVENAGLTMPPQEGVVASLTMTGTGGAYTCNITTYNAGGVVASAPGSGDIGYARAGWFSLNVEGTSAVLSWNGDTAITMFHGLVTPPPAGERSFGFAFLPTVANGRVQAKYFRMYYYPDAEERKTNSVLVQSVNGSVYVEDWPKEFGAGAAPGGTAVSTSCNLASDRMLMSAPYLQDLFIADWEEDRISGSDGSITAGNPERLTAASVADWTALSISAANDICVITDATGGVTNGTYDVLYVFAGYIHLHPPPGDGVSSGTCKYRVSRAPKVLSLAPEATEQVWQPSTAMAIHEFRRSAKDYGLVFEVTSISGTGTTGAVEPVLPTWNTTIGGTTVDNPGPNQVVWTTREITLRKWIATTDKGQVPTGCERTTTFNGRITLLGNPDQIMHQARMGDPWDFDYTAGDAGAAVYTNYADQYQIGAPLIAMAAAGADYLLLGTDRDMWLLMGDLAAGGRIVNLDRTSGIQDKAAWCHGPSGEVFFLANDGIRMYVPGASSTTKITKNPLPRELQNIDRRYFDILMEYDNEPDGFHVYLSAPEPRPVSHFFFDRMTGAAWRVDIQGYTYPTVVHQYVGLDPAESGVIHGCRDGRLRRYRVHYECDDEGVSGSGLGAYVIKGPIMVASGGEHEGVVARIVVTLAEDSGPVTCTIRTGPTAEAVLDANTFAGSPPLPANYRVSTHTLTGGLNKPIDVRQRGAFIAIILGSGASKRGWALESFQMYMERRGPRRL